MRRTASPAELHSLSERELLDRALVRDQPAWREMMRRFRHIIYRAIARVAVHQGASLGRADADDIFGELFVRLLDQDHHKLRAWDPARGTRLGTWLGLLAMNATWDALRAGARAASHLPLEQAEEEPAPGPDPLDQALERERHNQLVSQVSRLSPDERRLIRLHYIEGLVPARVARALGTSLKAFYLRTDKLRAKLRSDLGDHSPRPTKKRADARG